jgi:hypothetical protein
MYYLMETKMRQEPPFHYYASIASARELGHADLITLALLSYFFFLHIVLLLLLLLFILALPYYQTPEMRVLKNPKKCCKNVPRKPQKMC